MLSFMGQGQLVKLGILISYICMLEKNFGKHRLALVCSVETVDTLLKVGEP